MYLVISLTEICYNWKRNLEDEDIWEYLFHRNWKLANRYLEKEESWQKRVLKMSKVIVYLFIIYRLKVTGKKKNTKNMK